MMGNYLDKWKTLFPEVVGGTKRPLEAISDQDEFNTNGFPQFIAQDPVRYDLQNAFLKQFLSNDAWLWVRQQQADQALDRHKDDAQAHPNGVSGNAASATKLQTARSLNLGGAVTADASTFDGTANATINVKTLDATKLKGTASVSTTGNAATATKVVTTAVTGASANIAEASMGGSDSARIRVSGTTNVGELALETADDGDEAIVARQYTGAYAKVARTASILDKNGNTSFPGTVFAPNFTGALSGNAATATKLQTPRTLSLTGNASGSTTFDGSGNVNINTTVNTINNQGDKTAIKDGTTEPAGLNLYKVYNNGYPAPYGNLISIGGKGGGELLAEWSGTDREIGHLYYRNRRDMASVWSNWSTIAFTTDINDYAPTKTGGGASGTWDINISGTATKLATARTISLTGNASGSATFDGSNNISISTTVNESKHAAAADNSNKLGGYPLNTKATGGQYNTVPLVNVSGVMEIGKYIDWHATSGGTEDYSSRWTAETNGTVSVGTINGTLKGNADTATTATTAANANKLASESGSNYLKINTTDDRWSVIGPNPGYWLKSIRTDVDAPPYSIGNYSTAIAFGGYDTKGIITHAYDRPDVKFAGGSGSTANWKFTIHGGSNNEVYDLNNFPTKTGGGASGTWGINISGNAASATNATKIVNNGNRNNLADGTRPPSGLSVYQCYENTGYPQQYGNVISIGGTGDSELFLSWVGDSRLLYRAKRDHDTNWTNWRAIAFTDEINNYAPTKTGGGASGTWGINISGNADTVDGYHASDLLRTLGGNRTPVITDIFDRAGTIDMSTMSAADKATHKANINKATNMTQNIWNNTTGIHAYGGDTDMNGYKRGTLKLTQSYKNFDKILVFGTNDEGDEVIPRLYDAWELTYLFSHSYRFLLFDDTATYWELHGSVRIGTNTDYALSTDTIWSCEKQSSGIIGIYGIKY